MKVFFLTLSLILSASLGTLIYAQSTSVNNPDSLLILGNQSTEKADYKNAALFFQRAMRGFLEEKDSVKWTEASLNYGESLIDQGKVQDGLDLFLRINENLPLYTPVSLRILMKSDLGWASRKLEQYEKAHKYYLEGLELAYNANDSLMIARINNNLATINRIKGNYSEALGRLKKSIHIYRSLKNTYRLSLALNSTFSTLSDLGLYKQAERYLRESLRIREQLQNPDLLDVGYHNMAWLFKQQGKTDSAIIYYQKSLELSRMLNNPFDITQTLNNIGTIYQQSGDLNNSLLYYEESLKINEKTSRPISISISLGRIASVYAAKNDLNRAVEFYAKAQNLLEQEDAPVEIASLHLDIAELELKKKNFNNALELASQSLSIAKEKDALNLQIKAYQVKGSAFRFLKKKNESLQEFRSAYHLSANLPLGQQIWPIINLAKAYHAVGSDSAYLLAKRSFNLIDSLQTNISGLTFKAGLFRNYASFYNEAATWYVKDGKPAQAFELIESAKAQVLLDELAEAKDKLFSSLDETTLIKKQEKIKHIDRLHNNLIQADEAAEKRRLQNELKDAEFEYQTFLNKIRLENQTMKEFSYPKPISSVEVKELLDPQTALVEYAFSGNSLITFFITENNLLATIRDSVDSKTTKDFILENETAFRMGIADKIAAEQLGAISNKLFRVLLADFLVHNPGLSQLVFITDGPISFLPFEAFMTNGRYLIQDYNIKYLPSASIYSFIKEPHRTTSFDLLAMAGTGFESGSLSETTRSQDSYASLPSTILEVDSIASNFQNAKVLKNEDVTEAGLKSFNLAAFRFLHFATHGNIDEVNPSQSGLILSKKIEMESLFGEDGFLNSTEISTLRLNADMVVLSACNTGMGKIINGEGLLGLQRSFLTAGASSVTVSLWNVYDRSTALFMKDFYSNLLSYQDKEYGLWEKSLHYFGIYTHPLFDYKAKALREAKLSMLDHPYYNHPTYWAPFILIGK